jgi:endonuclease/exonuclease/phosphatase family metal-dependent hydrolase
VEFLSAKAGQGGNTRGLHGNAIFSRFPLERPKLVRLPIKYEWFYKEGDCRLGTRCGLMADALTPAGKVGLVCLHLENRTTPQGRLEQMQFALDQVDAWFPKGQPLLIGGDMNSNTVDGDKDADMLYLADHAAEMWRRIGQVPYYEPMLDYAASRGFTYSDCNLLEKTTRRKPMDDGRTVALNLDWFFQRGLACSGPAKIESIFHKNGFAKDVPAEALAYQNQEMSDHDMVLATCDLKGRA